MYNHLVHSQTMSQEKVLLKKYDHILKKRDKAIERIMRGAKVSCRFRDISVFSAQQ